MSENYAALIVDLVDSRGYSTEKREFIQHYILRITKLLNHYFASDLIRDADFSAGDEVQGLFATPQAAYLYYRYLSICLHPFSIRAGIGVGEWEVQIREKGTTGQDGSAYHRARHAILSTDNKNGYPVLLCSNNPSDITINTIIGSAASITYEHSERQNQLMLLTEILSPIISCTQKYRPAHHYRICRHLWEERYFFNRYELGKIESKSIDQIYDLLHSLPDDPQPIVAEDACSKNTLFVTEGKSRGLPSMLAEILCVSRQSTEKTLQAGGIYISRNMSITALNEMTKVFSKQS